MYTTKNGSSLVYMCPKDPDLNENNESNIISLFFLFLKNIVSCKINIIRSELIFQKQGCVGQVLKIERINEKASQNNLAVFNDRKPKMSHFQFKFDPYRLMYAGEIADIAVSELPSQRIDASDLDDILISHLGVVDKTEMISDIKSNSKYIKNSEDIDIIFEKPEKNYSKDIRLLRLFNNKIAEPEEFKFDENEESDDLESENKQESLFLQRDSQEDLDSDEIDLDNTFKSRKTLNQIINNQKIPQVIRNLKYVANFLMIILIAIAFSEYFVTYSQFNVFFY